jgi:LDH2 family malate/lactate/ureidoglycolate dehydrogenase
MSLASNTSVLVSAPDLQRFAAELLQASGVSADIAAEWAKSLVWSNLRGVDSHGVLRIPRYIELLGKKAINSAPVMRVEKKAGAIAVLEADLAPGPVAMSRAMTEAIVCAREVHIGWCAARNITHAGAIGYFALQAAEAGMAGIVMTASGPRWPTTAPASRASRPIRLQSRFPQSTGRRS